MTQAPDTSGQRLRPLTEAPALAAQAVAMLRELRALAPMTPDEARAVVALMRLLNYPSGATLLREGDTGSASHMLLLLDGEVSIDADAAGPIGAVAISVLGPGNIVGEMALLDGAPRSASCTAMTPVQAAGLSRQDLEQLVERHPVVAAKLMAGLAVLIADRLRALSQQLLMYAQHSASLQQRLERLSPRP